MNLAYSNWNITEKKTLNIPNGWTSVMFACLFCTASYAALKQKSSKRINNLYCSSFHSLILYAEERDRAGIFTYCGKPGRWLKLFKIATVSPAPGEEFHMNFKIHGSLQKGNRIWFGSYFRSCFLPFLRLNLDPVDIFIWCGVCLCAICISVSFGVRIAQRQPPLHF